MQEKINSTNETIYNLTEKHPEIIEILVSYGLDKLKNPIIRNTIGKTMTLKTVCENKNINIDEVVEKINRAVKKKGSEQITVKGILPCPIRIPLIDKIDEFIEKNNLNIDYTLPAASTGLDWLIEETAEKENLADIYLSAGFGLFFDDNKIGKFAKEGIFNSLEVNYNDDFKHFYDPQKIYTILGVVPAVFMVNTELLGTRDIPTKWSDLLKEVYQGEIAVPMKDLDLFNALLLGLYTAYGKEAIEKLGQSVIKNMHPAQMVKNASANKTPLVSIAPYFFASMLKENDKMKAVWPEDGAIASPIFLISKKESYENHKEFLDFLKSSEIGNILSSNGKFPSTVLGVNNNLSSDKKFIFSGFDFINNNDIASLLIELENIFYGRNEK